MVHDRSGQRWCDIRSDRHVHIDLKITTNTLHHKTTTTAFNDRNLITEPRCDGLRVNDADIGTYGNTTIIMKIRTSIPQPLIPISAFNHINNLSIFTGDIPK